MASLKHGVAALAAICDSYSFCNALGRRVGKGASSRRAHHVATKVGTSSDRAFARPDGFAHPTKRYVKRVMTMAGGFRSGTLDEAIFNAVVGFNEYRLPDRFVPGDIVIDIGAHIGTFAQAVLARGCENVYGIRTRCGRISEIAADYLRPHHRARFAEA